MGQKETFNGLMYFHPFPLTCPLTLDLGDPRACMSVRGDNSWIQWVLRGPQLIRPPLLFPHASYYSSSSSRWISRRHNLFCHVRIRLLIEAIEARTTG